jgi:hypothetical protein
VEPSRSEIELAAKLLETRHLSVPERRSLPNGRVALSALIVAARNALGERRFLPSALQPNLDFDGVVLERDGDAYLIHRKHEIGVGRFSNLLTERADLRTAVIALCGDEIDGIPVEHTS